MYIKNASKKKSAFSKKISIFKKSKAYETDLFPEQWKNQRAQEHLNHSEKFLLMSLLLSTVEPWMMLAGSEPFIISCVYLFCSLFVNH